MAFFLGRDANELLGEDGAALTDGCQWTGTLASQFANSPTLVRLLTNFNAYIDPNADIDAFYDQVWNVETAVGYGLDMWGRIVGVNRVLQVATVAYFGFSGPAGYSGQPWNQAPFYKPPAPPTSNYALLDGPYRELILAKAMANISNNTIPAINEIMVSLFGPDGPFPISGNCYCTDGLNMTMTYTFGSSLSPLQYAIVFQSGILPRPTGVSATVVQL